MQTRSLRGWGDARRDEENGHINIRTVCTMVLKTLNRLSWLLVMRRRQRIGSKQIGRYESEVVKKEKHRPLLGCGHGICHIYNRKVQRKLRGEMEKTLCIRSTLCIEWGNYIDSFFWLFYFLSHMSILLTSQPKCQVCRNMLRWTACSFISDRSIQWSELIGTLWLWRVHVWLCLRCSTITKLSRNTYGLRYLCHCIYKVGEGVQIPTFSFRHRISSM